MDAYAFSSAIIFFFVLVISSVLLITYTAQTINFFMEVEINLTQVVCRSILCFLFIYSLTLGEIGIIIIISSIALIGHLLVLFNIKRRKNLHKKNFKEKIKNYERIIAEHPEDWGTLSEIAETYFKIKEYNKAIETQKEVIRLSGNTPLEYDKLCKYELYIKQLDIDYRFCWYCGEKLPEKSDKCTKCGKESNASIKKWLKNGGAKKVVAFMALIMFSIVTYSYLAKTLSLTELQSAFFWITMVMLGIILKTILKTNQ